MFLFQDNKTIQELLEALDDLPRPCAQIHGEEIQDDEEEEGVEEEEGGGQEVEGAFHPGPPIDSAPL